MSCSVRPVLLAAYYLLNFAVIGCLLVAAFFISQGLFGDLYSCNEVRSQRESLVAAVALLRLVNATL